VNKANFQADVEANVEATKNVVHFDGSDFAPPFAPPRKTWVPAAERVDNRPLGRNSTVFADVLMDVQVRERVEFQRLDDRMSGYRQRCSS
jgi:hypothetical protein